MTDPEPPAGPTEVTWPVHHVSGPGHIGSSCFPSGELAQHFVEASTGLLPKGWRYRPCPHYPHLEKL